MSSTDFALVTTLFAHIENQFKDAPVIDYSYAIVNVLIRERSLYSLSEKTLCCYPFKSRFDHVNHMADWLFRVSVGVHTGATVDVTSGLLKRPAVKQTLDTFNVDAHGVRVNSYDCLLHMKEALTQLYISLHGSGSKRSYYDRVLGSVLEEVYVYLENYIKVIEHEQREPEKHNKLAGQANKSDDELSS